MTQTKTPTTKPSAKKRPIPGFELPARRPFEESSVYETVWTPRSNLAVRLIGAGASVPPHAVMASDMVRTNVELGRAVPMEEAAPRQPATGVDVAEVALANALRMADVRAEELDMLVVVTCTPDEPRFSHDAMALQQRLGIRKNAACFAVDSGCGGTVYLLDMVARMLERGAACTAAIVGDGDGAAVVRSERDSSLGIRTSIAGNDHRDQLRSPGGGTLTMARCMKAVTEAAQCPLPDVHRFYLHQLNARVLAALADRLRLRDEQVASNVAWGGNTSCAGMFTLLADDLEKGRVTLGSGTPVVLAAIGAGAHYGAQLVRL